MNRWKLSKVQISKIIQSGRSFGFCLGNLKKKALTNVAIPLAGDNFPWLVLNLTSSAITKLDMKISGNGAVRVGKWLLYLFQIKIWKILLKV